MSFVTIVHGDINDMRQQDRLQFKRAAGLSHVLHASASQGD